jgi:TPR repeat protein
MCYVAEAYGSSAGSCEDGRKHEIEGRQLDALDSWAALSPDPSPKERLRAVLTCITTMRVADDMAQAAQWLIDVARTTGNATVQMYVGMLFSSGAGVEVDIDEGRKWLRLAGDNGSAEAQKLLEMMDSVNQ